MAQGEAMGGRGFHPRRLKRHGANGKHPRQGWTAVRFARRWLVAHLFVAMIALATIPGNTAPAPDRDLFFVTGFRITGHSVFEEETLQDLIRDWVGRPVALEHLELVAEQISRHYRNAGYPLAFAYIPAQEVEEGVVEIAILEGRYDRIALANESRLKDSVARRFLSALRPGAVVEGESMERALTLLSDTPGIKSSSALEAGETTGTTRLHVNVADGKRVGGRLEVDNFGTSSTGVARYAAAVTFNNLTGHADQLNVHVLTTGKGQVQGQGSYEIPVGGFPTYFSLSYSISQYELGAPFEHLNAWGQARTVASQFRLPVRRGSRSNMDLTLLYESRRLLDDLAGETRKRSERVSLEWSGDWKGVTDAQTRYSVRVTAGNFRFDTEINRIIDEAGPKTQGPFQKLNAAINHYRWIGPKTALYAALRGQWASKNLDSSERFALAGISGVRAYASGAGTGADGLLGTLEVRQVVMADPKWGSLQLTAFIDGGGVRVYKRPPAGARENIISRHGIGVGALWSTPGGFTLQTHLAWKLAPDATVPTNDRGSQLWVQGGWAF